MDSENPWVSIIIPTFNSEKTLALCLQSIKNQTYPNIETIIVDGYSMDKTIQIAKQFNAKIMLSRVERSAARNLGAKKSSGVFVFFIDSDMELSPTVVEECLKLCLQKNVDAIIIPEKSVGKSFVAKSRSIEKEMRVGGKFSEAPRFFRKEAFNDVGGFDEKLVSGEDFDLGRRIEAASYRIGRCKAWIKHHEEELSMKKLVLKIYYYGKTLPLYMKKNPKLAMQTSCPIHILKNLKLISIHPKLLLGLLFLKLVEYMTYTVGAFSNISNMKIFKRRNFIFQEVKEQQNKLILDVGSGSNPRSDATHLCDLHVSSNNEREGNLLIDNRPFIRCSVEYLPFKEDAFAFAYASHVLEHTLHPNLALAEITRVAKTGYIESPTYLAEIIYGWSFHNCAVDFKNGKILFYRNPSSQKIIDMHYISKKIIPVRIFDYLLDCILGWHFLRIIWKKTATGTTFKRIILRNPYKCLLIYKKHKGAHYSDLGIYFKNL